jgi:transcriptional regulator with XRE-family HTH domain
MVAGRKPNLERWRQVEELRAAGLSLSEIGRRLGITRQAVQGMLRYIDKTKTRVRSVPCCACGRDIVSAGALSSGRGAALCLACLAQRPDAPFGQRLKAYRLAAGLTKAQVTARCGLSPNAVGMYEGKGITPKVPTALRLAKTLGVSPIDLGLRKVPAGWALPGKQIGRPRKRK